MAKRLMRARPPAATVTGGKGSSVGSLGFPAGRWYPSERLPRVNVAGAGGPRVGVTSMAMNEWPTRAASGVGERDVLGLPAFNRGKNLIAGLLAQMPLVDRREDGTPWPPNPVLDDPWPVMGRAEWISYQTDALIITGDAMALPADFDSDGFARQLVPIDPRAVDGLRRRRAGLVRRPHRPGGGDAAPLERVARPGQDHHRRRPAGRRGAGPVLPRPRPGRRAAALRGQRLHQPRACRRASSSSTCAT